MNAKKWIILFFTIVIGGSLPIGLFNFSIDPLWTFNHSHNYNKIQKGFNERQQKTDDIYFNGLDNYDGVLFGSSRSTFINQNDFYNMNIYNYAIDSMYPFEYEDYLNFAKKIKGADFKYIIIGADFYGTKIRTIKRFEDPIFYIKNTTSPFYRFRMLLSLDTFKQSRTIIRDSLKGSAPVFYTRDNIKHRPRVTEKDRLKSYTTNLKRHTEGFIGKDYQWNNNYIKILQNIKINNPNTKFIIFTSPITADLLTSIIVNADKMDEYERWLRELIKEFGEIHHFMSINSITVNLQDYADDDHYYPYIGTLLANKISKKENKNIPDDFGLILDSNNIDEYLILFRKQVDDYSIKSIDY